MLEALCQQPVRLPRPVGLRRVPAARGLRRGRPPATGSVLNIWRAQFVDIPAVALGITFQNIVDVVKERPDNLQRGANGTWSVVDSTSWATLARRWGDWKEQGSLALVGPNALLTLRT
eukprot:15478386-Alexandrium_andersonii.AAC.1